MLLLLQYGEQHLLADAAGARRLVDDGRGPLVFGALVRRLAELIAALALGSSSPLAQRGDDDLGRFGLGMKTASFSQCRRLTVASKKEGRLSVFTWDLDLLAETNNWDLLEVKPPCTDPRLSVPGESGTVVLWEKIDRTLAFAPDAKPGEKMRVVDTLKKHLRLTFHRFLEDGDFKLTFNRQALYPWDPFFSTDPGRPRDFPESVWPPMSATPAVRLRAFVLPRPKDQTITLFDPSDELDMQGFFIYRNKRLISAGGWLHLPGLTKRQEFALARIRLDFDPSSDADWRIDIRKSIARPPREIREWLTRQAVEARTFSDLELQSHHGGKTLRANNIWKKPCRGAPYVPSGTDPVMQTVFQANASGELSNELLQGVFEVVSYGHPSASQRVKTAPKSPAAEAAALFIYEKLKAVYGAEQAQAILISREPFASWRSLFN